MTRSLPETTACLKDLNVYLWQLRGLNFIANAWKSIKREKGLYESLDITFWTPNGKLNKIRVTQKPTLFSKAALCSGIVEIWEV